jgi:hypothetical protein
MVGGSSTRTSTAGAPERHVSSAGELSLIRDLRDQLKNVRQELKEVTALIAISCSKASQAMVAERYLLSEVESIGKSSSHVPSECGSGACERCHGYHLGLSIQCAHLGFALGLSSSGGSTCRILSISHGGDS